MKTVLALVLLGLFLLPVRAEDWATTDGKTYQNVRVLSHNAAYVTILHDNGGGRIPLSMLRPDLQKRFGYDPAKAPAILAATQAADQRDQEALADERSRLVRDEAQREEQVADGIAAAVFAPQADMDSAVSVATSSNSPAPNSGMAVGPAIVSEPPTEIDDFFYSDLGGYGYGGFGYGGLGYGGLGYGGLGYGGLGYGGLGYGGLGYRSGYGYGSQGYHGASAGHYLMHEFTRH